MRGLTPKLTGGTCEARDVPVERPVRPPSEGTIDQLVREFTFHLRPALCPLQTLELATMILVLEVRASQSQRLPVGRRG